MKKENKTLNEKIQLMDVERGDRYHPMIDVKDVKDKIQNAQRRLKEEFKVPKAVPLEIRAYVMALEEKLNKIFLEEFGDKLI